MRIYNRKMTTKETVKANRGFSRITILSRSGDLPVRWGILDVQLKSVCLKPGELSYWNTVTLMCQSWDLASQEVLQAKEVKENHVSLGENTELLQWITYAKHSCSLRPVYFLGSRMYPAMYWVLAL